MSVAKNRKLGSILGIVGILLLVIPFIPGVGLHITGDPSYVQKYPATVTGTQKQYSIYLGYGATATATGYYYYVDPFWDQDLNTIQDARAFVDKLNAGTAETYGHLSIRATNTGGAPLPSAVVKVAGFADQTTDANGWVYYFRISLKSYSYTVTAAGYQPAQGTVTLTQNGITVQKEVPLTLISSGSTPTGSTPPNPTPPTSFSVYVAASPGGSVNPSGTHNVASGGSINMIATAVEGYKFDHWVVNNNPIQSGSTYTCTVDKNLSIMAVFTPIATPTTPTEPAMGSLGYFSIVCGLILVVVGIAVIKKT